MKLRVEIISPEGYHFNGEVENCYFRTPLGEMGVLAGHCSFLVSVEEGKVILDKGAAEKVFEVQRGIAYKLDDPVTVLVESCNVASEGS